MVALLILSGGGGEGGHALCPLLEKWMSVVMAILILLAMASTLLPLRSRRVWPWLWSRSSSSHF